MKSYQTHFEFSFGKTAALLAMALLATVLPARATLIFSGVDLGRAGRTSEWALLALSGGLTVTDTSSQTPTPAVIGNVGAGGGGSITLTGTAKVQGTGILRSGGVLRKSGTATITGNGGNALYNDMLMNGAVADALAASSQANALADNPSGINPVGWASYPNTLNQSTPVVLNYLGTNDQIVLHLTDFVLTGGASLTLNGSAQTTYIFNIAGNFSLVGGQIILNGVLPENVLFNVTGSGNISLTSNSFLRGFLLAPNRTLNISGASKVYGTVIADKINISGASRIEKPTYTSL